MKSHKDIEGVYKAYQRIKKEPIKITGYLKGPGIEISITAKPSDWETIIEYYLPRRKELFKDLFPLMNQARLKACPRRTVNESRQAFVDIMKVQAGLIHGFLSHISKKKDIKNGLPSLRAIESNEHIALFKDDSIAYTQLLIDKIFQEHIAHNKLSKIVEVDSSDNFRVTYIQGGKEILRKDPQKSELAIGMLHVILASRENDPENICEFVKNLFRSIRTPIHSLYYFNNEPELSLMRDIILDIFPLIPLQE